MYSPNLIYYPFACKKKSVSLSRITKHFQYLLYKKKIKISKQKNDQFSEMLTITYFCLIIYLVFKRDKKNRLKKILFI